MEYLIWASAIACRLMAYRNIEPHCWLVLASRALTWYIESLGRVHPQTIGIAREQQTDVIARFSSAEFGPAGLNTCKCYLLVTYQTIPIRSSWSLYVRVAYCDGTFLGSRFSPALTKQERTPFFRGFLLARWTSRLVD